MSKWGYQNPEDWQRWETALLSSGDLKQKLPDINAAFTNKFVEAWNKPK
jgi:NitT/TauT family transport system substrate-binding protein